MATITPHGKRVFMKAITDTVKSFHLFVDEGEMSGRGYAPIQVDRTQWDGAIYPEVVWEFESGPELPILGYFALDDNDDVLYSEDFPEPYKIKRTGDRVKIRVRMNLLALADQVRNTQ